MSADKNKESGASDDVAAKAAEEILGPNPFVGLRPRDVLATAGTVGAQAVKQPLLLLEQEAFRRDARWPRSRRRQTAPLRSRSANGLKQEAARPPQIPRTSCSPHRLTERIVVFAI